MDHDICIGRARQLAFTVEMVHPGSEYRFYYGDHYVTYWPNAAKWRTAKGVIRSGYDSLCRHLSDLAQRETMQAAGFYWMKRRPQ